MRCVSLWCVWRDSLSPFRRCRVVVESCWIRWALSSSASGDHVSQHSNLAHVCPGRTVRVHGFRDRSSPPHGIAVPPPPWNRATAMYHDECLGDKHDHSLIEYDSPCQHDDLINQSPRQYLLMAGSKMGNPRSDAAAIAT